MGDIVWCRNHQVIIPIDNKCGCCAEAQEVRFDDRPGSVCISSILFSLPHLLNKNYERKTIRTLGL